MPDIKYEKRPLGGEPPVKVVVYRLVNGRRESSKSFPGDDEAQDYIDRGGEEAVTVSGAVQEVEDSPAPEAFEPEGDASTLSPDDDHYGEGANNPAARENAEEQAEGTEDKAPENADQGASPRTPEDAVAAVVQAENQPEGS